MNKDKAKFFDNHVDSPWAAPDYEGEDLEKIEWLFKKAALGQGVKVLEPGCGTGRLTELLAQAVGEDGFVAAMDISEEMVKKCRERVAGLENVRAEHDSLESMDLKENSFDLALSFNFFPHLDDKQNALYIFNKVLKKNGKLVIFHLQPSTFINDLHRKAGTAVQHDMIPPVSELARMLENAGFKMEEHRDDDRYFLMAEKETGEGKVGARAETKRENI